MTVPRSAKYFSWEKREKQCNACDKVLPLSKFREANNTAKSPDMASFYSYACRQCESDKVKARYKPRKKK